jgi:hypothetical protein
MLVYPPPCQYVTVNFFPDTFASVWGAECQQNRWGMGLGHAFVDERLVKIKLCSKKQWMKPKS